MNSWCCDDTLMTSITINYVTLCSLQWRHNGRNSVSNHQPHDCLLNCLFRRRWKKTLKLRDTGLCVGNSPGTGESPAQMASNAENVSIWWRHHDHLSGDGSGIFREPEVNVIVADALTPCDAKTSLNIAFNMWDKCGPFLPRSRISTLRAI